VKEINCESIACAISHSGRGKHCLIRSLAFGGRLLEVRDAAARPGTSVMASLPSVPGTNVGDCATAWQTFYVDKMTSTVRSNVNNYCLDVKGSTEMALGEIRSHI
jgi:hypothetical protein